MHLTIYIRTFFIMRDTIATQVLDTLSKRPEYGIISSMLSASMTMEDLFQSIGVILGLFIAVITAVLKVIELWDKLKERRRTRRGRKSAHH